MFALLPMFLANPSGRPLYLSRTYPVGVEGDRVIGSVRRYAMACCSVSSVNGNISAFNDADIASEWAGIMVFPFMFAMVMP